MLDIVIDKNDMARISAALATLDPDAANSSILSGITKGSAIAVNALIDNLSGPILKKRTGNLAASIGMHIEKSEGVITGVVGSGAQSPNPQTMDAGGDDKADPMFRMIYADILETGGQILPKTKQFLAIPIGDALTPAGVARFTAQQLKDGQASGYEGSVIIDGIIFGLSETKTRSNMTPLFVLKSSVDIPAFEYMAQTIQQVDDQIVQTLVDEIEKGLDQK
jgi:hypothetical protein